MLASLERGPCLASVELHNANVRIKTSVCVGQPLHNPLTLQTSSKKDHSVFQEPIQLCSEGCWVSSLETWSHKVPHFDGSPKAPTATQPHFNPTTPCVFPAWLLFSASSNGSLFSHYLQVIVTYGVITAPRKAFGKLSFCSGWKHGS